MNWPNDVDGDVFRRMLGSGFDFSSVHTIDFNVDFDNWPPNQDVIDFLSQRFGKVKIVYPDDDYDGFFELQVEAKVTYELVLEVQKEASEIAALYQGRCESWGVMQF